MKHPLETCEAFGKEMQDLLSPFCEKIMIVGSVRRRKQFCSDVELLFIPRFELRKIDMFSSEPMDLADDKINGLLRSGYFAKRPNINGTFAWGKQNKLAIHVESGIPVDLFSTSEENWFTALVIRTGGKETNLELTAGANRQNASLMAYGCGVKWSDGTVTRATSERHVFELCKVEYKEANERK